MRPTLLLTSALMLLGVSALSTARQLTQAEWSLIQSEYLPGQLLIKVTPGKSASAQAAIKKLGAKVVSSTPQIGWQKLQLKDGMTVSKAISTLRGTRLFDDLSPDVKFHKTEVPNDPLYPQQYSHRNMQVSQAWDIAKAGRDVIVAIIDDGVDSRHPDLAGRVLKGYDFTQSDTDTINENPANSHGTHVAGIVSASTNNGIGVAGVAYDASILPLQVFGSKGEVQGDWIAKAIIYAADNGAQVINMSLGGYGDSPQVSQAVDYAYSKNVVIVAAAGNDNVNRRSYPGAYEKVICVGATDQNDVRSVWPGGVSRVDPSLPGGSNYGADWVDVSGPGTAILSTVTGNGYENYNGTSMSSPNVAGAAALVIAAAGVGSLTNTEVRGFLESTTDPVPGNFFAHGRVNAYRAVLATPFGIPDTAQISTVGALEGTATNATRDTLNAMDGVMANVNCIRKRGTGLYGSLETTFVPSAVSTAQIRSADVSFTVKADKLAAVQIYLQDPATSRWVFLTSTSGTGVPKTVNLKLDKALLTRFQVNEDLRMLVRSFVPDRLAHRASNTMQIDRMQVVFRAVGVR